MTRHTASEMSAASLDSATMGGRHGFNPDGMLLSGCVEIFVVQNTKADPSRPRNANRNPGFFRLDQSTSRTCRDENAP